MLSICDKTLFQAQMLVVFNQRWSILTGSDKLGCRMSGDGGLYQLNDANTFKDSYKTSKRCWFVANFVHISRVKRAK